MRIFQVFPNALRKSIAILEYAHDIDGVKYPVGAFHNPTNRDGRLGWNYVAFSDEHLRVDHVYVWNPATDKFEQVADPGEERKDTSTCGPGRGSRMTGWIWLTWAVARAATMRGVARIRAACGEGGGTFSLFFSPSPARALPSLRPTFEKSARARERGRVRARRERFFVQIAAWSTFAQAAMRSGVCSASLVSSRARPTKLPSRTARDSTAA